MRTHGSARSLAQTQSRASSLALAPSSGRAEGYVFKVVFWGCPRVKFSCRPRGTEGGKANSGDAGKVPLFGNGRIGRRTVGRREKTQLEFLAVGLVRLRPCWTTLSQGVGVQATTSLRRRRRNCGNCRRRLRRERWAPLPPPLCSQFFWFDGDALWRHLGEVLLQS